MADTIQEIIDRIESARDRCLNAADDKGVLDAEQALVDLHGLDPAALPTAHDIEDYFNQRAGARVTKTNAPPATGEAEAGRRRALASAVDSDDWASDNS
jgi:hypothetical protein